MLNANKYPRLERSDTMWLLSGQVHADLLALHEMVSAGCRHVRLVSHLMQYRRPTGHGVWLPASMRQRGFGKLAAICSSS